MANHFDLVAPIYDYFIRKPDLGRLRELLKLPTDGRMLDVGGGTGRVSSPLRPLVGELVIGDFSRGMLKNARTKAELWAVQTRVELLPFPDASFDRILVVDAFHHFGDQRAAIQEILRVLKRGGRLVIEEQDINRCAIKMLAWVEKLILMRSHFCMSNEIVDMIGAHGLPTHVERDGQFLFWVVVDK
jgi:demethylmenaquinone methyltransferase/2-methoxy-6-polyprenyl-1,4-benzoquinol methylase